MSYIEVKTNEKIGLTLARKIAAKGQVSAVVTTGRITQPAKDFFNQHDIAYAEKISEQQYHSSASDETP